MNKCIMDAYNHGIRSAASTNWITEAAMGTNVFWSASSVAGGTELAWFVNLASGYNTNFYKGDTYQVVCVR
jgi:hypothetical protein